MSDTQAAKVLTGDTQALIESAMKRVQIRRKLRAPGEVDRIADLLEGLVAEIQRLRGRLAAETRQ